MTADMTAIEIIEQESIEDEMEWKDYLDKIKGHPFWSALIHEIVFEKLINWKQWDLSNVVFGGGGFFSYGTGHSDESTLFDYTELDNEQDIIEAVREWPQSFRRRFEEILYHDIANIDLTSHNGPIQCCGYLLYDKKPGDIAHAALLAVVERNIYLNKNKAN